MHRIDETAKFLPVNIAVATISDTRTAANDTSGDALAERVAQPGIGSWPRSIIRDDADAIAAQLPLLDRRRRRSTW